MTKPYPDVDAGQANFDSDVGRLDWVLSRMMTYARLCEALENACAMTGEQLEMATVITAENRQTLKHHAEDMLAAGQAILKKLGKEQPGTPQPEHVPK